MSQSLWSHGQLDLFSSDHNPPPRSVETPEIRSGFEAWYQSLRLHSPYPWQSRLARQLAEGKWPNTLSIPTGSGKTTVLDIWAWAYISKLPHIPRRVYWCVDRRLVVDSVALMADTLKQVIPELQTDTLRGGQGNLGDLGLVDPSKPAVIPTTIDQLGSRLLFRAYGSSHWVAPIHAGLVGQDALIVLDEAHLSEPFTATLESLQRQRLNTLGLPWRCLYLTATPRTTGDFDLNEADYAHPELTRRIARPKLTRLVDCKPDLISVLVEQALVLRQEGAAVVAVVVNTVATARAVFDTLAQKGEACLLTGRIRETDRSMILSEYLPRILAGSRVAQGRDPLFVVATQTIEVGADLDFDALVSECAAFSALRQRLGRLNRTGTLDSASAVVVACTDKKDPIYGNDSKNAWDWLLKNASKIGKIRQIDLSAKALQNKSLPEEERPDFPLFGDADLAVLAQTSHPRTVDISPWLHGYRHRADVGVVWRADLDGPGRDWPLIVEVIPPLMAETLVLPQYELERWLETLQPKAEIGLWDGDELTVVAAAAARLKPGITVILPADYGGCDRWGWAPDDSTPVTDQADTSQRVRLHPAFQADARELLHAYADEDQDLDERGLLEQLNITPSGSWQIIDYPGGLLIRLGAPIPEQVAGVTVTLNEHLKGTAQYARHITPPELADHLVQAVERAALWHDVGKRDRRFQRMLGTDGQVPLAKSITRTREQAHQARQLSGLPSGWRHEIASAAVVKRSDLIRYLIGCHHGRGRCWLPALPDPELWQKADGLNWPALYAQLTAHFDPWGLAYLEALVRLADWAESRQEAEGRRNTA